MQSAHVHSTTEHLGNTHGCSQSGCQPELFCHSSVSAAIGLGKFRNKLAIRTISNVDVDK